MKPHIWTSSSGGLQSRFTPRGQVGGQECLVSTAELRVRPARFLAVLPSTGYRAPGNPCPLSAYYWG